VILPHLVVLVHLAVLLHPVVLLHLLVLLPLVVVVLGMVAWQLDLHFFVYLLEVILRRFLGGSLHIEKGFD
jgi:hypothetical protein